MFPWITVPVMNAYEEEFDKRGMGTKLKPKC